MEAQRTAGVSGEGNAGKKSISESWPHFARVRIKLHMIKSLKRQPTDSGRRVTAIVAAVTQELKREEATKSPGGLQGPQSRVRSG